MLIGFAGFEDNNLLEVITSGTPTVVSSGARTGTYCLRCVGITTDMSNSWIMPVGVGEFYFQYAVKCNSTVNAPTDDHVCFKWKDALGNVMGAFYMKTEWVYDVYVGNKATKIGTMTTPISTNYVVIEGYIKIHSTAGRVVIKANGIVEVDFTGNTQPGAATEVDTIQHGGLYNFQAITLYFDDIIVQDTTGTSFNSWPMGIKCYKVDAPLANGNYAQWTPSAGDNFECIDEAPPSMDDYVEGAVGEKDSYAFGDAPAGLTGIAGVVTRFYGQGNGNIKRLCRHGGTDYLSAAFAVPGTFNKVDDVMPEKPGGGGWDEATFNACEFGMEHQ